MHLLAALYLTSVSAGYTSRQLLLNMKYSCSLFFLLCIFASITLKDRDVCGCILASPKVYMAEKAEDTLGEMGVQTFEIH